MLKSKLGKVIIASLVMFSSVLGNSLVVGAKDNCHIGLDGHKGNQHKVDFMTKYELEEYFRNNGFSFEQMSNNEGSNGWITYHIYDESGHQIEVVHVKYKEDVVEDGTSDDNMQVEPPVLEGEDDFLTPQLPVGDGSEDDNMQVDKLPEVSEEEPSEEPKQDSDEDVVVPDKSDKPLTFVTDSYEGEL